MKRIKICLLLSGTAALMIMLSSTPGISGVDINVGINVPPPVVIAGPPAMFYIPGTSVYFIPNIEPDIFFYHGYWYRKYLRHWFRSGSYNGRWVYIAPSRVPRPFLRLPSDYRHHLRPGHERIPYERLKKNWRTWEREKYWDRRYEKRRHR